MLKSKISSQKLFFPFACLLGLICAAAALSYQVSTMVVLPDNPFPGRAFGLDRMLQLVSIALFAVLIVLVRNVPFKTIFKSVVAFSALVLLAGWFVFPNSLVTYFFTGFFCPKALPLLGWAYINQTTNVNEGIRYYFGMSFVSGLIATAIGGAGRFCAIYNYGQMPIWIGLLCLALVFVCERIIHLRMDENEEAENTSIVKSEWLDAVYLGVIAYSFMSVSKLLHPIIMGHIKTLAAAGSNYSVFMGNYTLTLASSALLFSLLSIFVGPRVVEKRSWKYAVLIVPFAAFIALLTFSAKIALWTLAPMDILLIALDFAWIVPLVQIAFLNYAKKTRFSLQAWAVLVVGGLYQFIVKLIPLDQTGAIVATCVILGLMIGSTILLSKPK